MIAALRNNQTTLRFIKFLAVGVLNTAFGVMVYEVLVLAGMPPQPALALAYIIGIIWNYFTHARMVFGSKGFAKFPAYVGAYLVIFLANAICLHFALQAGVSKYLAQPVLAVFMAVPTFFLISWVLTGSLPVFGRFLPGSSKSMER